jgi:tripartite-type tricarboxylate transporter receptor subunit TctC
VTFLRRRHLAALLAPLAMTTGTATAQAIDRAARPARILVGFSAGGTSDILARVIATAITNDLGRPIIVENKPGANGNIAAAEVARAPADGLTLYIGSFNNPVNHAARRELPFDFMKDFVPVAMIATVPNVLVVRRDLAAQNVRELIALARREPGRLTFASSGAGSSLHMAAELFKVTAHVDMLHVPYRGSAPAYADLLGGSVDMMFDNLPAAVQLVRAGSVRALAVTGTSRVPALPEVPTIAEAALPGYDLTSFFALFAPTGTPPAAVAQFNDAVNRALARPEIRDSLTGMGATPAPGTPDQLRALTVSEVEKWRRVIEEGQIRLE